MANPTQQNPLPPPEQGNLEACAILSINKTDPTQIPARMGVPKDLLASPLPRMEYYELQFSQVA